jgi:hypothetical protein
MTVPRPLNHISLNECSQSSKTNNPPAVNHIQADFDEARRHLASVALMLDEGARSQDPRVTALALALLAHQAEVLRW